MNDKTALGYAQLAAQRLDLPPELTETFLSTMDHLMDEISQEQAEEVYRTQW